MLCEWSGGERQPVAPLHKWYQSLASRGVLCEEYFKRAKNYRGAWEEKLRAIQTLINCGQNIG